MAAEYLKMRIMLIVCVMACIALFLRVISGNNLDLEPFVKVQPVFEILLVCYAMFAVIPWIQNKIHSTSAKDVVEYALVFGGIGLIIMLVPEYAENPTALDTRLMALGMMVAVAVGVWGVGYVYQRWKKKKGESKEELE